MHPFLVLVWYTVFPLRVLWEIGFAAGSFPRLKRKARKYISYFFLLLLPHIWKCTCSFDIVFYSQILTIFPNYPYLKKSYLEHLSNKQNHTINKWCNRTVFQCWTLLQLFKCMLEPFRWKSVHNFCDPPWGCMILRQDQKCRVITVNCCTETRENLSSNGFASNSPHNE